MALSAYQFHILISFLLRGIYIFNHAQRLRPSESYRHTAKEGGRERQVGKKKGSREVENIKNRSEEGGRQYKEAKEL